MNFKTKISAVIAALSILIASVSVSANQTGTVTGSVVNVRSGAGVNYPVVTKAYGGGAVNVVDRVGGWTKVLLTDGSYGYISSDYVTMGEVKRTGYITGSTVNVREGAGVSYKVLGTVSYGQPVAVTGQENDWFSITFNGTTGYVCGQYVTFEQIQVPTVGEQIVSYAKTLLGKPYVYGAAGPNSFDCSGFTSYVFRQLGYSINRTAAAQYSNGTYVDRSQLQPGDLVMFGKGYINHVGIYVGNNQFIHAENAGTGVVISNMGQAYYSSSYAGARRIA